MAAPEPHLDLSTIDMDRVIASREAIRKVLPHRFEMEMLSGIVYVDPGSQVIVGYKDVDPNEFWARGHFPGLPIMPGVLMCEAAAQLCAYYALTQGVVKGVVMGLGGIENTRFRRFVRPGERLVLIGKGLRVRPRMTIISVQGFVGSEMAFHTEVLGMPIAQGEEMSVA